MTRARLQTARAVVVKVGSSLLADLAGGLNCDFIAALVDEIAAQRTQGRKVVLVSSGAVAAGTAALGWSERPTSLPLIQAAAAVGQGALMQEYRERFGVHGILVGQVLLTRDGLHNRQRFLHARNTLESLLAHDVIPIVNENDTVAVEELKLKMGDNDGLAVSVAQLVDADCLVILSDVPGLYEKPPGEGESELISHVPGVTPEVMARGGGTGSGVGSGGMSTKLNAALAAHLAAIPLVVADGKREGIVGAILAGEEVGTFFAPRGKRVTARQQWIAFGRSADGVITVDAGAVKALTEGKKSLLAIGVRDVAGTFSEADTIGICDPAQQEFARGLTNFSSDELRQIMGKRSDEFAAILGVDCCDTVVHRDNLVILHEDHRTETGSGQ